MNNKDFIAQLAAKTQYKQADTQRMVTAFVNALADTFQEGNNVTVQGFGTFEIKKKMERIVVNPSNQKRMLVPPKLVLSFKPSNSWKDKLKS